MTVSHICDYLSHLSLKCDLMWLMCHTCDTCHLVSHICHICKLYPVIVQPISNVTWEWPGPAFRNFLSTKDLVKFSLNDWLTDSFINMTAEKLSPIYKIYYKKCCNLGTTKCSFQKFVSVLVFIHCLVFVFPWVTTFFLTSGT